MSTDFILIPLHGKLGTGKFARIDAADYDLVKSYKWRAGNHGRHDKDKRYAIVTVNGNEGSKTLHMHRLISGATEGQETDHRDGDTLNNRRINLRNCTRQQNAQNQSKQRKVTSSIYKGVSFYKRMGKWEARIYHNARTVPLGFFAAEREAAAAYDQAARHYFGEFANTNFQEVLH